MKLLEFRPKLFDCLKNYSKRTFASDLMAGIIVGIVALPLAIAFGIASGVSPEKGIVTAILAGLVVSLLGGSRVQIGGPTGAFIVIIYGIIQQYGEAGLIVATLMAGVLLVLMGVFRLGAVIKFIPYPVVVGFTSGIAVTIFTTQIADVFGLDFGGEKVPGDFVGKWLLYFRHFGTVDWGNAAVSVLSVLIIALVYRKAFRGVLFSPSFANTLIMLCMITTPVVMCIKSNIALSMGMVGALSIVRFRTAIKDPMDTVFMFWSIVIGIITGAGYITVAILAALLLGALFLALNLLSGKLHTNSYLVVMRYTPEGESAVRSKLGTLGKYKLKSRTMNLAETELVVEAKLSQKQMDSLEALLDNEGVSDVNIVSYNGSTLL